MEKTFISDLQDKQVVTSTFLAKNKVLLRDKKGKSYLSFLLSDSTGEVDAKTWDNVEQIDGVFHSGDIVQVKGLVQVYQNRRQIIVHKLERHEGQVDLKDYIKGSDRNPEENLQELLQIIGTMKNAPLQQLILDTINDPTIKPLFLIAPAAKSIHHAKFGGLLEHILSVTKLTQLVCQNYPELNSDLLIYGAIFHDIGKIWELKIDDGGIQYTDKGRLIGHMVLAVELVEKKASRIFNFPEELKDVCKHMILGHHGKHEFGSPKLPQTLEAYMLWLLDEMDSKMDSLKSAMAVPGQNDGWSQFSTLFERHFYLKGNQWDS